MGDDKEEIDDLMYYCKEGEEVEISGFVCGSSHYMETKKLYPGDIIHNFGKDKYRLKTAGEVKLKDPHYLFNSVKLFTRELAFVISTK